MRTHGAVVDRPFRSVTKLTTKVRIGRGYLWGSFLIAAAALKTPTRNGYNAQGVNLKSDTPGGSDVWPLQDIVITNLVWCIAYKREVGGGVLYCPINVQEYRTEVDNAGGRRE